MQGHGNTKLGGSFPKTDGPYYYRHWREGSKQRKAYVPHQEVAQIREKLHRWQQLHPPAWSLRQDLAGLRQFERQALAWTQT